MRNVIPFLTNRSLNHGLWSEFDDVFANFDKDYYVENKSGFVPATELEETDKYFLASMDLPGMKKEDIKIEVVDNHLIVSGERKRLRKKESKDFSTYEKSYGSFRKSFVLNSKVDIDQIEAHYENGVLDLSLPKANTKSSKTIEIQSGKESFLNKFLTDKKD